MFAALVWASEAVIAYLNKRQDGSQQAGGLALAAISFVIPSIRLQKLMVSMNCADSRISVGAEVVMFVGIPRKTYFVMARDKLSAQGNLAGSFLGIARRRLKKGH